MKMKNQAKTAAASQELNGQASELKNMPDNFRT